MSPSGDGWFGRPILRPAKEPPLPQIQHPAGHPPQVLRICQGNISQAARLAKKDRKDFYDVMKKYGIQPEAFRKQQAG